MGVFLWVVQKKCQTCFSESLYLAVQKLNYFFANPNSFKSSFSIDDNLVEPEIVSKSIFHFPILRASDDKSLKMPKPLGKSVR